MSPKIFFTHYRYDANTMEIITRIITRLSTQIAQYKEKIVMKDEMNKNKDIPFSSLYQRLLTTDRSENLISLLLHADGISLTRSTKLKLWMLSGALIELPPKLRNRHCIMVLISIWIANNVEPSPQIWLNRSLAQLEMIKFQGKKTFHPMLPF